MASQTQSASTDKLLTNVNNHMEALPHNEGTKARYWKNLLILSISFLLIFIPYLSIQNLSSTLYEQAGLGVAALACVYSGVFLTCIIAPYGVQLAGCKTMLVGGFIAQTVFTISNIYPRFYTLVPASLLIGIMSSFMWTAQGTYITALGIDYANLASVPTNSILSIFNGMFYFFFQNSQIWGNILTSFILSQQTGTQADYNINDGIAYAKQCGIHFCGTNTANDSSHNQTLMDKTMLYTLEETFAGIETTSIQPARKLIYILISTFVALDITAILLASFLLDKRQPQASSTSASVKDMILSTLSIHKQPTLALLVPWFVWNGMEQGYFFAEYTQAFPGCLHGVGKIGYTMVGFGVVNALSCILVGPLERLLGRVVLFMTATVLNLATLVAMVMWDPSGHQYVLYILPVLWGVADSIWQATTCTFLGMVFQRNQEAAFASFRMWQAFGFVIVFSYSHFLCMDIKTYISLAWCLGANVLYIAAECLVRRQVNEIETPLVNEPIINN